MSRKITVYGKENCRYCTRAKSLLEFHKWDYEYLTLGEDYSRKDLAELVGLGARMTVPQIVIDGELIGGYSDLVEYMNNRVNFNDDIS